MTKRIIIKDLQTNKYYTDEYNNWWSLDILKAYQYSLDVPENLILDTINEWAIDPLKPGYYQLITIYIK